MGCDKAGGGQGVVVRWLSCNGNEYGLGPTAVFGCAAAIFLFREIGGALPVRRRTPAGDLRFSISYIENALLVLMVLGTLTMMVHMWICSARFLQYYLEAIIQDYPAIVVELSAFGLTGAHAKPCYLDPMTRFLQAQQGQIHVTVCWFLALSYADYVRTRYAYDFTVPYIDEWSQEFQTSTMAGLSVVVTKATALMSAINDRIKLMSASFVQSMRGGTSPQQRDVTQRSPPQTDNPPQRDSSAQRGRPTQRDTSLPPTTDAGTGTNGERSETSHGRFRSAYTTVSS